MALIQCPECGKEISDQATTCPSCGCPIKNEAPNTKKAGNKKMLLTALAIIVVVAVVGTAAFLFLGKNDYNVKHKGLGYLISIGMEKKEIEELLGNGTKYGEYYEYIDGMTISYSDGKVDYISIDNRQWETPKGVSVGDKPENVFAAYGENELTDISTLGNGKYGDLLGKGYIASYYLDEHGKVCDLLDSSISVSVHIDESKEKVTSISISKKSW